MLPLRHSINMAPLTSSIRMKTLVHPLYQFDMQSLGLATGGQGKNDKLSVFRDPAKLHDTFRSLESAMTQACQLYKLASRFSPLGDSHRFVKRSEEVDKLLDKLQYTVQKIPPFARRDITRLGLLRCHDELYTSPPPHFFCFAAGRATAADWTRQRKRCFGGGIRNIKEKVT
jgi:hypothetical protein